MTRPRNADTSTVDSLQAYGGPPPANHERYVVRARRPGWSPRRTPASAPGASRSARSRVVVDVAAGCLRAEPVAHAAPVVFVCVASSSEVSGPWPASAR